MIVLAATVPALSLMCSSTMIVTVTMPVPLSLKTESRPSLAESPFEAPLLPAVDRTTFAAVCSAVKAAMHSAGQREGVFESH
jgi:hypothetical protein